jgi:hypothetical protein
MAIARRSPSFGFPGDAPSLTLAPDPAPSDATGADYDAAPIRFADVRRS